MTDKPYYLVRELKTTADLIPFLRIRYASFRASELRSFVPDNIYGIDLDTWDKYALHFGLFEHRNGVSRPVGYMRFIGNVTKPSMAVMGLLEGRPLLKAILLAEPVARFPALNRHKTLINTQVWHQWENAPAGTIIEASRFTISDSVKDRNISAFFVDAVSAIFLIAKKMKVFLEAGSHHVDFYRKRYGYQVISQIQYPGLNRPCYLLRAQKEHLSDETYLRIKDLAKAFIATGVTCYDPNIVLNRDKKSNRILESESSAL